MIQMGIPRMIRQIVEISKISSVTIVKTATVSDVNGDGLNGVGDIIEYTIVVTNTGNTKLTSSTILDSLTDGLGNPRSLNSTVDLCLYYCNHHNSRADL